MSVKGQANSQALRRLTVSRPFHELMEAEAVKHKMSAKDIADQARLPMPRIKELMRGDDLPTRREFTRLGHALTALSFMFDVNDLPPEETTAPPRRASGPDAPPREKVPKMANETKAPVSNRDVQFMKFAKQAALVSVTEDVLGLLKKALELGLTLEQLLDVLE